APTYGTPSKAHEHLIIVTTSALRHLPKLSKGNNPSHHCRGWVCPPSVAHHPLPPVSLHPHTSRCHQPSQFNSCSSTTTHSSVSHGVPYVAAGLAPASRRPPPPASRIPPIHTFRSSPTPALRCLSTLVFHIPTTRPSSKQGS